MNDRSRKILEEKAIRKVVKPIIIPPPVQVVKKKIDNSSKLLQVKFDNEWNGVMEQFNQDNFDYNRYLTLMGVFKFINSDDFNKTTEKLLKDLYSHLTSGDQ